MTKLTKWTKFGLVHCQLLSNVGNTSNNYRGNIKVDLNSWMNNVAGFEVEIEIIGTYFFIFFHEKIGVDETYPPQSRE